jgi:hypothetical protein
MEAISRAAYADGLPLLQKAQVGGRSNPTCQRRHSTLLLPARHGHGCFLLPPCWDQGGDCTHSR